MERQAETFLRRRARVWQGQTAVIPGAVGVTPQGAPVQAVKIIAGCPKCGKAFKKGLTMHVKHCKGLGL